MESRSHLFELGWVSKVKGIKGEFQIILDTDNPGNYKKLESVLIEVNHELIPFFIESVYISGKVATVKCEGLSTPDDARLLIGSRVYLPLDKLTPLPGNRFYFHEIINCTVVDKSLGPLGILNDIYDETVQPVAVVLNNGKEILFPLMEIFIENFDRSNNTLFVNLPEGLVAIYLEK